MNAINILIMIFCYCLSHISVAQSIRKPWREMTAGEQEAYVTAINSLPGSVPQTLASEHERLALLFNDNGHIHNSNIFLPWHRVYILYFEEQLKAIDPDISLPYWDWTTDWSPSAALFGDDGGGNTGLFGLDVNGSVWQDPSTSAKYVREFDISETQPTSTELTNITNTVNFTQHRMALEGGPHNTGHRFVGEGDGAPPWGTMATMFSPADPIFYLHHSMVDKIWNDWVESNWTGGTLPFDDDSDPESDMLTFIGYQGSTNPGNVVRVDPNDWIESRDRKTWYAENGMVSLNNYTVSNLENYRYTGIINLEDNFLVASGTECDVLSGSTIFLRPGFSAANGSAFMAGVNSGSFGRMSSNRDAITKRLDKKHRPLLEASLEGSKHLSRSGIEIYGINALTASEVRNIVDSYPNPSPGEFTIKAKNDENYAIRVVDALGRDVDVKVQKLSNTEYQVELINKTKGYYLLKITSDTGKTINEKIFIR